MTWGVLVACRVHRRPCTKRKVPMGFLCGNTRRCSPLFSSGFLMVAMLSHGSFTLRSVTGQSDYLTIRQLLAEPMPPHDTDDPPAVGVHYAEHGGKWT
jgi:hypothetical protein